ncbi:MAG: hypothetical protein E6J90_29520 [Deltaproteobacteria bacterium]|nr:MAG: hypothetical protein E6J90_29520 [Deltaproteobacteria bacterium]
MNDDDNDIRSALARAHEPAAPFEAVRDRRPRRARAAYAIALALAASATAVLTVERPSSPGSATETELDLGSPALSSTALTMPLDSLLDVPGLAVLATTPSLMTGGLP